MAKISKFVKLDKDVLLEYIYDDGNLISESYDILVDSRDRRQSYISGSSSITGNTIGNQLYPSIGFELNQTNNFYFWEC